MRSAARFSIPVSLVLATALMSLSCSSENVPLASERPADAYEDTLLAVSARRERLASEFEGATTNAAQRAVFRRAAEELSRSVGASILPFWYDTPWTFNGTSQTPGEGSIACGYFVTTALRDAGVEIDRVAMAQAPSEVMIRSLVADEHIRRFSNTPLPAFVTSILEWGEGVYVVGLDCHVGFIIHDGSDAWFVHSSFVPPCCVVSGRCGDSRVLGASRYRVVGKLTADEDLLRRWLVYGQ